jgi:hypothetical protein
MATTLAFSRLDLDTAAAAGHAQALAALPIVSSVPSAKPTEDGILTLSINAPAPAGGFGVKFTPMGSTVPQPLITHTIAGENPLRAAGLIPYSQIFMVSGDPAQTSTSRSDTPQGLSRTAGSGPSSAQPQPTQIGIAVPAPC